MAVTPSLSAAERRSLAVALRKAASVLDDEAPADDAVAVLSTSMRAATLADSAPWRLSQPHSETMPWKLLLSQWSLLGPHDQVRLRGVCSGLREGDLTSFLLHQDRSIKYSHLDDYFGFDGDEEVGSVSGDVALDHVHDAYVELRFIRDVQARCAAAEATEFAVAEAMQQLARDGHTPRSYEARQAMRHAMLETFDPGDARIARAAKRLAEMCPGYCAATVAGSFALHRLQARVSPQRALEWKPDDMDIFVQSDAALRRGARVHPPPRRRPRRRGLPCGTRRRCVRLADEF